MGIVITAQHHGQKSIFTIPSAGCQFQLMPTRYPALWSDEENKLVLPAEKVMKYSLFLKLPLSSRNWLGSNTSGLGNSLSSCSTEVNDVNTSVTWKEQMKINWTTQKSWNWTNVANHLVQFYDLWMRNPRPKEGLWHFEQDSGRQSKE